MINCYVSDLVAIEFNNLIHKLLAYLAFSDHLLREHCLCGCVRQIEQARLVQQYCDKADACLAKQDHRTVSNLSY